MKVAVTGKAKISNAVPTFLSLYKSKKKKKGKKKNTFVYHCDMPY